MTTKLEWIYPLKGNESAVGLVLNNEGKRDYAIKEAQQTGKGVVTKLIQLKQGGLGFLSIHPTYLNGQLNGYIVGVYRTNDIFAKLVDDQFILQIKFNDEVAFPQEDPQGFDPSDESEISVRNIILTISLRASNRLIESRYSLKDALETPFIIVLEFLIVAIFSFLLLRSREKLRESLAHAKEAEFQMKISQDAALAALETKTRFLANMSHEIRTPMNGILGLTELLRGRTSDDYAKNKLASIQRSGQTLLKIIDDILDFSKLEAGKVDIELVPIDLKIELTQLVELLEEKACENESKISLLYPHDLPKWIYADPTRIRQIVTNLLSNAIKFTQQGSIEVRVAKELKNKGNYSGDVEIFSLIKSGSFPINKSFSAAAGLMPLFLTVDINDLILAKYCAPSNDLKQPEIFC